MEQLFTLAVARAWQQIQALREEFNKRFEVLHQAPITQCTPREEDEEDMKMRRSKCKEQQAAKRVNQRQVAAIKGFRQVLFLILLGTRVHMVKAAEAISIHREVDRTTAADLASHLIRLADNSNSCRRMESFEGEWEKKEGNQKFKRGKQPGERPKIQARNRQGKDPRKKQPGQFPEYLVA